MPAIPGPLDAIANISITMFGNGGLQISGNIADVKLALTMLDHARDAVKAQLVRRDDAGLLIPPRDVVVPVNAGFPLTEYGTEREEWHAPLVAQQRGGVKT